MIDAELKNVVNDLVKRFTDILKLSAFADVVRKFVEEHYIQGAKDIAMQFNFNYSGDPARASFLSSYVFDNIKGMNEDIADRLRKEISQGLLNLESVQKLKGRVQKVMGIAVDRARTIAITEANRAENAGNVDAARASGLTLVKEWDAHLDKRTSAVCRYLDKKTQPMDGKFKYQGEEFDSPPAHPRCRSRLIFIQK